MTRHEARLGEKIRVHGIHFFCWSKRGLYINIFHMEQSLDNISSLLIVSDMIKCVNILFIWRLLQEFIFLIAQSLISTRKDKDLSEFTWKLFQIINVYSSFSFFFFFFCQGTFYNQDIRIHFTKVVSFWYFTYYDNDILVKLWVCPFIPYLEMSQDLNFQ